MKLIGLLAAALIASLPLAGVAQETPQALPPEEREPPEAIKAVALQIADQYLATLDANHDGKLTLSEYLAPTTKQFHDADSNNDGVLDKAELTAAIVKEVKKSFAERLEQFEAQRRERLQESPVGVVSPAPTDFDAVGKLPQLAPGATFSPTMPARSADR